MLYLTDMLYVASNKEFKMKILAALILGLVVPTWAAVVGFINLGELNIVMAGFCAILFYSSVYAAKRLSNNILLGDKK